MAWSQRLAGGLAILLALGPAILRAQTPDSARHFTGAAPAAPGPRYPLVPTQVQGMRAYTAAVAASGWLMARATHRADSTAASLNRARLTAQTAPLPYLGVKLQVGYAAIPGSRDSTGEFALTDAYLELSPPASALKPGSWAKQLRPALLAGQFKAPFSLEYLTPFQLQKTADFAQAVDRLSLKRDIGLMGQVGWSRYAVLALAAMNGAGPNAIGNPQNELLAVSRLTLTPLPFLAAGLKIADRGSDHAWGYDARLLWRGLTLEGETVFRERPASPGIRLDAGGGYALVAYRVRPWLEPVYKYDRYWDAETGTGGGAALPASRTWQVVGLNLVSAPEWLRLQLDWRHRQERPTPGTVDELVAQLVAIF